MTTRLRVVVVMPEAPHPFGLAAARWYYVLLKGLADRGHDIRAYAAYTRRADADSAQAYLSGTPIRLELFPYPDLGTWWQRKWATLRRPYSYFIHPALSDNVAQALRDGYDILHLEQMWTGYLGLDMPRTLLSVHHLTYLDLLHTHPRSARALLDKMLMARTERWMLTRFKEVRATTNRLASEIGRINPASRVTTIPIALDPSLYPVSPGQDDGQTVGFIGSMQWSIGREAAVRLVKHIWPRVRSNFPAARLLIAGWGATDALAAFQRVDGVTILGDVPDAWRDFFKRVTVFAYPLTQGSGMKVKVLEAMAYGVPVVGTREGLEGVMDRQNGEIVVADDDETLARSIVSLLGDRETRQRLSEAGRKLVESHFSPAATIPQMEQLYMDLLNGRFTGEMSR